MAPGRALRDLTTTSAHLLHPWGNHVAFRRPGFLLCEISELEEGWLPVTWTKLRDLRFCCCCCCYVLVSVRVFQRNCNEKLCVCVCVCVYTYIKRLGIKLLLVSFLKRDFRDLAHTVVVLAGMKSVGQISRLKTQKGFLCYRLEAEFLLSLETKGFPFKTFN